MKSTTKLEKLINKTFIYKQEHVTIRDYFSDPDTNTYRIITDKKPIAVKESELTQFITALLPTDDENTQIVTTEVIQQTTSLIATLQETLLDNIERVKKDKDYIKQANVVNSSVNALIGMAKLQVQVGKIKNQK